MAVHLGPPPPTNEVARSIAAGLAGEPPTRCERFPTGLRNYVYDIEFASGEQFVLRFSPADEIQGTVFWTTQLRSGGVPAAQVLLTSEPDAVYSYSVLERLPGTDLGNVFDDLDEGQLSGIADEVASWQRLTEGSVAPARKFGFALDYDAQLFNSWTDVLLASLTGTERLVRLAAVVDPAPIAQVADRVRTVRDELDQVQPRPFLHDATTKNVIVHDGFVTGLVDVDFMGFGDPLYLAALTRMSLLSAGRSPAYAVRLAELIAPDAPPGRFDLYTMVHCAGFLGELGQTFFNQTEPAPIDATHQAHLEQLLYQFLA